jgi:hypothetical protein
VAVRAFEQKMLCQRVSDQRIFRDEREIGKLIAMGEEGDGALSEVRNSRAVTITKRVQDKLTGRDFDNDAEPLDIDSQARRLTRCRCQCFSHALSAGRPSHIRGHFGGQSQPSASLLLLAAVLMNQNLTLIAAVLHWMVPVLVIAFAISSSSNKFACSHFTWTSAAAHDYGVCAVARLSMPQGSSVRIRARAFVCECLRSEWIRFYDWRADEQGTHGLKSKAPAATAALTQCPRTFEHNQCQPVSG